MLLVILLFIAISVAICVHKGKLDNRQLTLWFAVFVIYGAYMLVSNWYVKDPNTQYFLSPDQRYFYRMAVYLSQFNIETILNYLSASSEDSPRMALLVNALWVKLGQCLNISDMQLFLKLKVVYIGSLIPVIMYDVARFFHTSNNGLAYKLLLFAVCSPLLSYSVQILRDTEVTFIYILCFYLCIAKNIRVRYLWVACLAIIAYFYRIESGLFLALFVFISVIDKLSRKSRPVRIIAYVCVSIVVLCYIPMFFETTDSTLTGYADRSAHYASADSLGMAIWNKLGPLAPVAKVLFTFILPFPLWMPISDSASFVWLRGVEVIWGFYWLPIMVMLFIGWWRCRTKLPKEFTYYLWATYLFLILNAIGEFNPRRMMAVYPIMYVLYIRLSQYRKLNVNKTGWICLWGILLLNGVYFLIKG